MPFLLCCKESSLVVINNLFSPFIHRPFQMSGPIKHSTTGLWVKKRNTAQRAEKKSGLIMNIHVVGGLNDCCLKELWAVANSLSGKRQMKKKSTLFFFSQLPNVNVREPQHARLCVPTSDSQNPNIDSFFPVFFCQQIWAGKFLYEVVLSRMATNRVIAALARAHFSILGFSFI